LTSLTIEHVMPQALGDDQNGISWRNALGSDWKNLHEKWVHTFGNLTLTGYNPNLSNSDFITKRGIFAQSNVSLNQYFTTFEKWGFNEIKDRGLKLARSAARLWPRPSEGPDYIPTGPGQEEEAEETEPRERIPPGRRLHIRIRWSLLDRALPDEEICKSKSSDTVVAFIEKLIRIFGKPMEEKLTTTSIIRTFSLSRSPNIDFLNRKKGKPYSHALIPGTDLYVCTISDTPQKVNDLKKLVARLFPHAPGGIVISAVE